MTDILLYAILLVPLGLLFWYTTCWIAMSSLMMGVRWPTMVAPMGGGKGHAENMKRWTVRGLVGLGIVLALEAPIWVYLLS